jgi:chaperone modulatory protein CbpM
MPDEEIIPVELFCSCYNVELTFLETLESHGLISIGNRENQKFIQQEDLVELEKYTRMYYDLNINVEGIDALNHLLDKLKLLSQEADSLRARLRIYE